MAGKIEEQIIVITGCSSGIGLATAALLAKQPGNKVIATMRNLEKQDDLVKAAGADLLDKTLHIRELDVTKENSIAKFLKETYAHEGRIDVLVNNAGIGHLGAFEDVTTEQMETMVRTNFLGPARLTQDVVKGMKKQRSGKIIFVSSIFGVLAPCFGAFYVSTKHAIEGLVESLAPVLSCFNISITSVQPAYAASKILENAFVTTPSDSETGILMEKHHKGFLAPIFAQVQPSEEVAEVIKSCIIDPHPLVKVRTSATAESHVKTATADRAADLSGNTSRDKMKMYLLE